MCTQSEYIGVFGNLSTRNCLCFITIYHFPSNPAFTICSVVLFSSANPLAWISPDDDLALQLGNKPTESGLQNSHDQPSKKKKTSKLSTFGSNDELADR